MAMEIQPHDLIKISDLSQLKLNEEKEWVAASLRQTPFVVVRRSERTNPDYIPVGIRGVERNQRETALLHRKGIASIITPYGISERKMWQLLKLKRQQQIPVLRIIDSVTEIMRNWRWGPTGSAGFEMATGNSSLKETSDLDIVIDVRGQSDFREAGDLLQKLDQLGVRIDIQIETKDGVFILREIIDRRANTVILRTCSGPKLVSNPWF
jgi:phosphoribosyl-dephospho-CoA transferase